MKAKSYGAGTIINALAMNFGSAFALDLKIRLKLRVEDELKENIIIDGDREARDKILDEILSRFNLKAAVEVKSDIPRASGLGSSSAFINALLVSIFKYLNRKLTAHEILRLNSKISLDVGISYTGAFDDASASLLGGIVVTNNRDMKLMRWEFRRSKALVLIPNWSRKEIDLKKIRKENDIIKKALRLALEGDYKHAMFYNSIYYCKKIGYPFEVIREVSDLDCFCGLSGNGPCYVAFGKGLKEVKGIWEKYGRVIKTRVVCEPCDRVIITPDLFNS